MSWSNTHRKATTGQKLFWTVTGIGMGVLAGQHPTWQRGLRRLTKTVRKGVEKLPVMIRPNESDIEELVAELAFSFGGPLEEKGREQVDKALAAVVHRLTGVQLREPDQH